MSDVIERQKEIVHVRHSISEARLRKDLLRSGERSGADVRKAKVARGGVATFSFGDEAVAT
jgi:hypothetical protein